MRIAYLTACSPLPPTSGYSLRVHALWRALGQFGRVEVFAFDTRPSAAERKKLAEQAIKVLAARREGRLGVLLRHARSFAGDRSMIYSKALSDRRIARLRRHLLNSGTDLLVVGDTWLADLVPRLKDAATRIIVDTHNVESILYRRMTREQSWPAKLKFMMYGHNVRRLERQFHYVDAVWAVSPADARFYREQMQLPRVHVLPNAIDVRAYAPQGSRTIEPGMVVFTGSYGYWPNEAAALHLIALSVRLNAAAIGHRMMIVGRDPTPAMVSAAADAASVTITGAVDDIRPYIRRAEIVAAPLTSGSGTKYKLLEALALGKPVLTTQIGAEGLDLVDDEHAAIVPDLASFDTRLTALLRRPKSLERLGGAGRRWLEATHSIEALERRMASALVDVGLPLPAVLEADAAL